MGSVPFAFSVQHFINSVGADAGFASIIGLAVLVLLYFAQARETASLRDQAYEASQRADQLEGRLAQLSRSQAAAAPVPAMQPAQAAAGAVRPLASASVPARSPATAAVAAPVLAGAPAAPAGVGAPALTAATRLIPAVAAASAHPATAAPSPQSDPAGRSAAAGTSHPVDLTTVGALPPATAAGGANGTAREGHSPVAAAQPPATPPRVQIRPGGAHAPVRRAPVLTRPAPVQERSRGPLRLVAFAVAALLVVGVVAALLLLTRSTGQQPARTSAPVTNAPVARHHARPAAGLNPASVSVAVLNGTASSGLAHRVSVKLGASGFKPAAVATAADQTRTATVVAFMPGHRRDALAVASALKLGSASVQPVDQNTQAVACPPPSACSATVVVTVGADLSSTP